MLKLKKGRVKFEPSTKDNQTIDTVVQLFGSGQEVKLTAPVGSDLLADLHKGQTVTLIEWPSESGILYFPVKTEFQFESEVANMCQTFQKVQKDFPDLSEETIRTFVTTAYIQSFRS
ncbi:MAG: hypothetical protein D6698_01535 [Gammaproteobacteria bacterium]|nr:MAG: hypothetical protein D6698_01535 [Gammaproteobacteria bacterium]